MVGRAAASDIVDGVTYWSMPSATPRHKRTGSSEPSVYLLSNYDELMNALRDRELFLDPAGPPPPRGAFEGFPHQLAIDGVLRGAWKRTLSAREIKITVRPFRPLSKIEKNGLAAAVQDYGTFLNLPAGFSLV